MKAQELRIGNYVCTSYMKKSVFKVNAIHSDRLYFESIVENFKSDTIPVYIEPIELTDEWLVKSGANKINDILDIFELDRFQLLPFYTYSFWKVIDKETKAYIAKVSVVHELQNMYVVLNGEELPL